MAGRRIFAFALFVAALAPGAAFADGLCRPPARAPAVTLTFTPAAPQVTHVLDHAALGRFTSSTTFSHHQNEVFQTGGITESNIRTQFNLGMRQEISASGSACLYVDTIEITLLYKPVVHIASNFPAGSCRFKTTWEHELRHVNTDLITLRENQQAVTAAATAAAPRLAVSGPLPDNQLPQRQQAVVAAFGQVIEAAMGQVDRIRMQRQQLIDTREEYLRLSRACP